MKPSHLSPALHAHRGASALEPENTLRAFARAIQDGADGIELDVRVCRTGELVVLHDPDLQRLAGDPALVSDLSLTELQARDVGRAERVPLLDEVLDLAGDRVRLNIELKTDERAGRETARMAFAVASALWHDLGARGLERAEHLLISSFDPRALALVRLRLHRLATGLLCGGSQGLLLRSGVAARVLGTSAIHPEHWLVDRRLVEGWHAVGKEVNVWTVDDPPELRRLAALGVDAIITNDPRAAREAIGGRR